MAGETVTTVVGNLTDDPELRFTPSGAAVAKFTVASTPRIFDKPTGEYKDGTPLFLNVSVWREQAEHVAESLTKGARVVVMGRLKQENWEDKNGGGKRSRIVLEADEVAPSLRFAEAKVVKAPGAVGGIGQAGSQGRDAPAGSAPFADEPPF